MPELPEAETICRALGQVLPGRVIKKVEIFSPAMRTSLLPLPGAALTGVVITGVRRRGRYVVIDLDDGRCFLMHFGMSGVVRVEPPGIPRRKHEHLFLSLSGDLIFKFECPRRFSLFELTLPDGEDSWPKTLAGLGPEPLTDEFDGGYLYRLSRKRRCPVKQLLMDNGVVTGIGNIYAAETLFASGIDPRRRSSALRRKECDRLAAEAKRILCRSIERGGSSISDFLHVDGSEGKYSQELAVYGKNGQPCPVCGTVIRQVRLGGRSSCYCPKCQK